MKINRNSIIFNISILFFITTLSVTALFVTLIHFSIKHRVVEEHQRHTMLQRIIHKLRHESTTIKEANEILKEFDVEIITDSEYILKNATLVDEFSRFFLLIKDDQKYVFLKKTNILLKDLKQDNKSEIYLFVALIIVVFVILFLYVLVVKKLSPLKKLQKNIKKIGDGDLEISVAYDGEDEIAILSREFDSSIKKIKKLTDSRTLFLRNAMHELKTPITKGKITTELLDDDLNKQRLQRVFTRLESIINQIASIEQLTSGNILLAKKDYAILDIIDGAIDLLMEDKQNIEVDVSGTINADYDLLVIAFKNLIDNAIKYSTNKKITIKLSNNCLSFESIGEKFRDDFENYLLPFSKRDQKNNGFGLGLYIVDNILKTHGFKILYKHENGVNILFFCF